MQYIATLDQLHLMLTPIKQAATSADFDPIALFHIELAAEEALVNIIQHGYTDNAGPIEIECYPSPYTGIRIIIRDNAIPYNPLEKVIETPLETPLGERVGGFGIFLIRTLMDEVTYERVGEQNVLTLIKSKN